MPLDIGILNRHGAGTNPRPNGTFSPCNVPTRPARFDSLQVTDIRRELVNVLSLGLARTPWLHARALRPDPGPSSVADTEIYLYYGNAGAAETNDADTWSPDYGVVYHLKEDPAGAVPQPKDSTVHAVHGTYDVAGANVEVNTLWGVQVHPLRQRPASARRRQSRDRERRSDHHRGLVSTR